MNAPERSPLDVAKLIEIFEDFLASDRKMFRLEGPTGALLELRRWEVRALLHRAREELREKDGGR